MRVLFVLTAILMTPTFACTIDISDVPNEKRVEVAEILNGKGYDVVPSGKTATYNFQKPSFRSHSRGFIELVHNDSKSIIDKAQHMRRNGRVSSGPIRYSKLARRIMDCETAEESLDNLGITATINTSGF